MNYFKSIIIALLLISINFSFSQTNSLKKDIEQLIKTKRAEIGVAISLLEGNDTLTINNEKHYPMLSVYKFHLALAVLDQVDKGIYSINQKIFIKNHDLKSDKRGPLKEKYPKGNIELTLGEILTYTISKSDNNSCDILFKLIGGTKEVDDFIHNLGLKEVSIKKTEDQMRKSWNNIYKNWTTPFAAIQLLEKFYKKQILTDKNYEFLLGTMINSSNDPKRIKGMLPEGTIVAHKTGSSGKNEKNITAGLNDIGIVNLPNGKHFAIAVFVSNSKEDDETNAKIIAEITKLVWDYYIKQ
jgi:beta-lactamase class A